MELGQLVERLSAKVEIHESEAAAFAQEVERGRDVFESECGRRYHDGCGDAIRETVELIECVIESDRKRDEWLEHNRVAVGNPQGQLPESFEQSSPTLPR